MHTKLALAAVLALAGMTSAANAAIPVYPSPGVANPVVYGFNATATGDVMAYFAGSSAGYTSEIGLSVNGGPVGLFCLNNKTSALGASCNLGAVTIGDTLEFILKVFNTGAFYSSNALNNPGSQNHIYSTPYAGGDFGIPAGIYVGFEDLPNLGDKDYNDHQFVFTNVGGGVVPEPATWAMLIAGFGMVGFAMRRRSAITRVSA
jgi:hypothetical protein